MLGASVAAQAGASVAINGPAFLIPALQQNRGLSLAQAGTVAAMPLAGVMVTLFLWGLAVDRVGERAVLLAGLDRDDRPVRRRDRRGRHPSPCGPSCSRWAWSAASTGSASGRIVVGWFPPERRGLAMGIRQMAQPLGVAVAAATVAVVAERSSVHGRPVDPGRRERRRPAGAVVAIVLDPPRPTATAALTANPYRTDGFLARIHGVSVLLVVPQFLVWTFSLTWLVQRA